jgi:hypothetical protein
MMLLLCTYGVGGILCGVLAFCLYMIPRERDGWNG